MSKIRIIQIGLGHDHAGEILDTLLRNSDIFEVVGFAVPPEEEKPFSQRIFKYITEHNLKKYTVEKILELPGLQAAAIETEELNLTKYATLAAAKGLHIHMDKPGGDSLEDFKKLIDLLKEKNLKFSLGYMYRFNPYILEAKKKIASGELGEIYAVEAHMDCEHPPKKRQWLDRFPGGMMFFLGCHLVDIIFDIMGKPTEVIALNYGSDSDGVTAKDVGFAIFKHGSKVSFAKTSANEAGGFLRRQLVICGTKGTIEIRPLEFFPKSISNSHLQTTMRYVKSGGGWLEDGAKTDSEPYNRYNAMMKCFYDTVVNGKTTKYTYDYELELYKTVLKACGVQI